MIVTIRTRTVGQFFGTVGQLVIVGRRRRVIAEGDPRPYGFDYAARQDALAIAIERGLTVVDSDGTLLLRDGVRVGGAS